MNTVTQSTTKLISTKSITRIPVSELSTVRGQKPWEIIYMTALNEDFDGEYYLENVKVVIDGEEKVIPIGIFVPHGMDLDIEDVQGIDPRSIPDPESFELAGEVA